MATPPTVITYKDANAIIPSATATRTLTQISVTTSDIVAVVVAGEDYASIGTLTVAKTAGTSVIGTVTTQRNAGTTLHCALTLFTFPVTTGGTLTLTITRSVTGSERRITTMTYVASACAGVGVTAATTTSTTTITASITPGANSYIGAYAADWNAIGGATTTLTPAGGVVDVHETDGVTDQVANGSIYSSRAGHWLNSSAGTASYGVTAPSSAAYNLVVFELLPAIPATTATPAVIQTSTTFAYSGPLQPVNVAAPVVVGTVTISRTAGYFGGYQSGYSAAAFPTVQSAGTVSPAVIIAVTALGGSGIETILDNVGITDSDRVLAVDSVIAEPTNVNDTPSQYTIGYGEQLSDNQSISDAITVVVTSTAIGAAVVIATAAIAAPNLATAVQIAAAPIFGSSFHPAAPPRQDQALIPATVTTSASLPTSTVRRDSLVAISGRVSATTTVPTLALAVGSTIAATTIPGAATAPPLTVRRDANQPATPIAPPAVSLPTSAITAISSENPTPAVVIATTAVPFPAMSAGVTVAAVQTSTTIAAATAAASSTATPGLLSPAVGARIPTATITAEWATTVVAAPITTAAVVGALSLKLGQTVEPDIVVGTCAIPEAAAAANSTVSAELIIASATVGELTVSQDVEISADGIPTASTVLTVTLQTGSTVTAEIVSGVVGFAETATAVSQNIAANVVTTTATIIQPEEITHAASITAETLVADTAVLTPNVYTVPDHPPVINPTRTRNLNPISRLHVINGTGAVRVPPSAVHARLTH